MARCRCQNEEDRARRNEEMRWIQSNLPLGITRRTFDTFNLREGTKEALAEAWDMASGKGGVLFLVGSTGTGKSHLLEAIGRHVLESRKDIDVRYETSSGLLNRLREAASSSSDLDMAELWNWYQRREVLLLDDIGAEKPSEFVVERLTSLVDDRLRRGTSLAIATNLTHEEMASRLGDRLASRLYQTNPSLGEIRRVTITSGDYRMERGNE